MMLAFLAASLLAQADLSPSTAVVDPAVSAERAALAAERAALAAERAAAAAERIAAAQGVPVGVPVVVVIDENKEAWKGSLGIGVIAITGNAQTLTGTLNGQIDRKFGNWAFGLRANGAYGQTTPPAGGDPQIAAERASLSARLDRAIASFASVYVLTGVETDHVKSVEVRGFGELGTGLTLFERKEADLERVFLRTDIAFRYSQETRFQYFSSPTIPAGTGLPGATLVAPRLGVVFRYALNKDVRFSEEAEFLPNLVGASRFLFNSNTKLNARMTSALSVSVSFLLNFDSAPGGGKKDTDTALTLGLEAAF